MAKAAKSKPEGTFKSTLSTGPERFLAQVWVRALEDGWRNADDFLRHFPPPVLMQSLANAEELRATLLVKSAGVHERIARKKSTATAAEDLQIALDESLTDAATVLELLPPDERVRYLDATLIWKMITEGAFWKSGGTDAEERVMFLLESALDQGIITIQDIMDGLTFDEIAARLPEEELRKVVKHALDGARGGRPLDETSLLQVVSLQRLVEVIPLEHTWQRVVLDRIARPSDFAGPGDWQAQPVKAGAAPAKPAKAARPRSNGSTQAEPAPPDVRAALPSETDEDHGTVRIDGARQPHEEQARRRVADRLRTIDRLPPNHETLSLPILLSVESMYAELLSLTSDEQREACIRESFPNESHLRTAILALIELFDPSIDTSDPVISDGDIDSLVKVVLFEERTRYEQGRNPARTGMSASVSPSPPAMRRAQVPPPAARRSSVPAPSPRGSTPPPPIALDFDVEVDDDALAKSR